MDFDRAAMHGKRCKERKAYQGRPPLGGRPGLGEVLWSRQSRHPDVARPWARKFLGFSVTWHKQVRLKIAASSLVRLKDKMREIVVGNVSRNLAATISALNPVLRGWASYFGLTEVKGVLGELDGWIRRKLRCLLWRQWKRPATRNKRL
jgi:RNA-directed DNA polymerase